MIKSVEAITAPGVETGMLEVDAPKGLDPRVYFIASKYSDDLEYCTLSQWVDSGDKARRYFSNAYKAGELTIERVRNVTSLRALA